MIQTNTTSDSLGILYGSLHVVALFVTTFCLYMFLKHNGRILAVIGTLLNKFGHFVDSHFGSHMHNVNLQLERNATIDNSSLSWKIWNYYNTILANLGLKRAHVSIAGLLAFITIVSAGLTVLLSMVFGVGSEFAVAIPMFFASFILVTVMLRLNGLTYRERKETSIMQSVDILISDITGGVFNAILRYKDGFSDEVRKYFDEFVDNIRLRGMSFNDSMYILNLDLGPTFTEFAHKAVSYEAHADADMADIFSNIIDRNRQECTLRSYNDERFSTLRRTFIISSLIILAYAVFMVSLDPFVKSFFLNTLAGKWLIIFNMLLFAFVMGRLAALKSETL